MAIKLVATDIDGTILKYSGEFSPAVLDCIHNLDKNGIKVVLVTGRMHKAAQIIEDEIGITTPIVSYQGGLVRDKDKILYEKYLPDDKIKEVINWGKEKDVHINMYMNDNLYVEKVDDNIKKYVGHQNVEYTVAPFDSLGLKKVNKLLFIDYSDAENIKKITSELQKAFPELYVVQSSKYFCEICNKEATKGNGLECIRNYYGVTKDETLTIGDHNNDIELLLAGGIKVAMGNATDDLKAVADYVTDTVENDGFVKAMEKFVKVGANV